MLKDLFIQNKAFKLVCGAGNEDIEEVEKLVTIYSKAGCKFFDLSANTEVIDAAKRALKRTNHENDSYICVSVGISGDPHITKAKINEQYCKKCNLCKEICPHSAITCDIKIIEKRCLGCSLCAIKCPNNAIKMESKLKNYNEILPEIINKGIDCIEFHAISTNEHDVEEKWNQITNLFDGMLCISLDRSELGDKKLIERVKKLISQRAPYTTIIQADGVAMSGNNDEYSTTLQAVATAQLFQNAKLPVFIMMSGGTNTKSTLLAKTCGVKINCLAVGSYARKIVSKYLQIDNLLENEKELNEAVKIAKSLIDTSLENMIND